MASFYMLENHPCLSESQPKRDPDLSNSDHLLQLHQGNNWGAPRPAQTFTLCSLSWVRSTSKHKAFLPGSALFTTTDQWTTCITADDGLVCLSIFFPILPSAVNNSTRYLNWSIWGGISLPRTIVSDLEELILTTNSAAEDQGDIKRTGQHCLQKGKWNPVNIKLGSLCSSAVPRNSVHGSYEQSWG